MSTPQELTAAPALVYTQIPKQVARKDFNRYIALSLKRPTKGPPPKLSLYKIFNYILGVFAQPPEIGFAIGIEPKWSLSKSRRREVDALSHLNPL